MQVIASHTFQLPKRLARRLLDLQLLPYIVVTNPHIEKVYKAYYHAFNVLKDERPPATLADNEKFISLLRRLVDEHGEMASFLCLFVNGLLLTTILRLTDHIGLKTFVAPMLDALANGLREIRKKPLVGPHLHLDKFLEAMLRSRISRRVLAEQHININNGRSGYIGIINTDLSLADAVDFAAARCRQVCMETFGVVPEVMVSGDTSLKVPYIPAHMDYMLYELLKNASRSVVERHYFSKHCKDRPHVLGDISSRLPVIHVRICGGKDDVTIRISDQGGGIPPQNLDRVWEFGWTDLEDSSTVPAAEGEGAGHIAGHEGLGLGRWPDQMATGQMNNAFFGMRYRMAGLGFGLPLSRLYARYFGGDLRLVSLPGYGVDAFLYLKGLSNQDSGKEWREEHEDNSGASSIEEVVGALSATALGQSGAD